MATDYYVQLQLFHMSFSVIKMNFPEVNRYFSINSVGVSSV